jgi:hypothetical protein
MIALRFGRWSSSRGRWFTWERIYWLGWKWTPFVWVSWRYPKSPLAKYRAERVSALEAVIDPIREHDRRFLRKWVERLKTSDGEGWAVGEMLERACILLDALEVKCES